MNRRVCYVFIVAFLVAIGCVEVTYDDKPIGGGRYSERMINSYRDADSMSFQLCYPEPILEMYSGTGRWLDDAEVDNLSKKYNDKHWNRVSSWKRYSVYSNEFTGISVVSDTDYNNIPAGYPLDPIVRIMTISPYRWLNSNGTLTYDWTNAPTDYSLVHWEMVGPRYEYFDKELFPVYKCITDLKPEDLMLLNMHSLYLLFTETPEIKEHNLKITFKDPRKDVVAEGTVTFK